MHIGAEGVNLINREEWIIIMYIMYTTTFTCYVTLSLCTVLDRMKPVSQASFRDHVAEKHEDRDKGFEAEYQVWKYQDPAVTDLINKLQWCCNFFSRLALTL